jgi:hypothetical protein
MRFEIDENNAVKIWQDDAEIPFIYQPNYPAGNNFENGADAESWAVAKINEFADIDAPAAPNFPGESEQPQGRKIAQQREMLKASAKAKLMSGNPLTAEEADTLVF